MFDQNSELLDVFLNEPHLFCYHLTIRLGFPVRVFERHFGDIGHWEYSRTLISGFKWGWFKTAADG